MASDSQILAAMGMKAGGECRYFELVDITCSDIRKKCFVCVGKHSLYFLRQDLNGPIHVGADVNYSFIAKVVQDENSDQHCLLVLSDVLTGWGSDRLFIKAENRNMFLRHLRCSWQTDHMWRLGRVVVFPLTLHTITKERCFDHYVMPYQGHRWTKFQGYRFMMPDDFVDQPNSIQDEQTGEYVNSEGVTLVVHVHEAFSLDQLSQIQRDHIRWVAADYKVQLCSEEKHFYVIKNCTRAKRMNLGSDIAQWHQWELIIRTKSATLLCMLMRRQFIPPVCHSGQDIAVLFRIPEEVWRESETKLLLGAYRVADSLCIDAPNVSIYRDMVQAKLDALRFDEEGLEWVASRLKLKTRWETEAKRFVRTLWKLLCEDKIDGYDPDLLGKKPQEVLVDAEPDDEWANLDFIESFADFIQEMTTAGEGLPLDGPMAENLDEETKTKMQQHWLSRVARYFAWAVDGGLLGARFNLDLLIEGLSSLTTEEGYKKGMMALTFMLHLRPRDMSKYYTEVSLVRQLTDKNLSQWMFNDRVMLAILSTDFLKKLIGKGRDADFFRCTANLLEANCGYSLKAYVCRLFMEMKSGPADAASKKADEDGSNLIVVPAMMSLLKSGSLFLATYASAALVNLSNGNPAVKRMLMGNNMAVQAAKSILTKDDDLSYYTLMLLVNLTKEPHNRSIIASAGIIPMLYDMLTSSYHQVRPGAQKSAAGGVGNAALGSLAKERLLTQVSIVIGQFCNDDGFREQFIDMYPHTVKCMLYMFTTAQLGGMLTNKVSFALKQLCASRNDQKHYIGNTAIPYLIEGLAHKDVEKTPEFLYQSLLLLIMLSGLPTNCELMYKEGLINVLQDLSNHPIAKKTMDFHAKAARLFHALSEVAAGHDNM
eukprot:gb/GFBE01037470.1/.p1 GENE.gb/GFBE01037470.1/~~gb/GFBE01037470.1/.p1  ORF type:complete len:878 (+),score=225.29 gb/GFBE01037470.1/:1-2634(+)